MAIGKPRPSRRARFVWRASIASGIVAEAERQVAELWCSFTMMSRPSSSHRTHSSRRSLSSREAIAGSQCRFGNVTRSESVGSPHAAS
jgi:hypothetical protein